MAREGINWSGVRDEYVTGDESFATIGRRYGVSKSAVEKHASDRKANGGRTWGEWRADFRDDVSVRREEISGAIKVEAAATVAKGHVDFLAGLASAAREVAVAALRQCEPVDQVKYALAIVRMERSVHGLDRAPVKVEVTGKDGQPIEHDVAVDIDVDDEVRDLAASALDALFGKATKPD